MKNLSLILICIIVAFTQLGCREKDGSETSSDNFYVKSNGPDDIKLPKEPSVSYTFQQPESSGSTTSTSTRPSSDSSKVSNKQFEPSGSTISNNSTNTTSTIPSSASPGFFPSETQIPHSLPTLFVGGSFCQAGGIIVNYIASWDGLKWSSLGGGVEGSSRSAAVEGVVTSLASIGDSIYVGGAFQIVDYTEDGVEINDIAKWDGSKWSSMKGLTGYVYKLISINNDLYVSGSFPRGVMAHIAKWNAVTSSWSSLGDGVDEIADGGFTSIGTDLYVGGMFHNAGGIKADYIAKWDTVTSSWSPVGGGTSGRVYALASMGTDLYVAGDFTNAGGIEAKGIAKWDTSTSRWSSLGDGIKPGSVYVLTSIGTDLYVGGTFTVVNGIEAKYVAKWDTVASKWSPVGDGASATVYALTNIGTDLYVGGDMGIIKWDIVNSTWSSLGRGVEGPVDVRVGNVHTGFTVNTLLATTPLIKNNKN